MEFAVFAKALGTIAVFDQETHTVDSNLNRSIQGNNKVNCNLLAEKMQKLNPTASPTHIARLCLMLLNSVDEPKQLENDGILSDTWADVKLRFQAATDQHAAMTQELEDLASSDPRMFTPDQIWILVRAIKVQSQVLKLYAGESSIATT